ncbi:hypothetical protein VTK73DRAFT_6634 [Phialemonium thermophilum]|uniref:Molybdenum cofactor sulfurase n=1 Tax=Phialemonium thermophilum TaxID=223376 RepID=A0ABR3XV93_9PEZI
MEAGHASYNAYIESMRDKEYPMLRDCVYLDHAGTTLYPKSLMDRFHQDMMTNLFGNPHSASSSSQLSTSRVEDARLRVLQWCNANPADFDVVFVANATGGAKLVAEALRTTAAGDGCSSSGGGFDYLYHRSCHTSLVGVREEARDSLCFETPAEVARWRGSGQGKLFDGAAATLIAYPAQSNMDGRKLPLAWSDQLRRSRPRGSGKVYTMLDAAALASTSPLDLSDAETAPDFTVLSFYKIFGFPDLGALIVRREAEPAFAGRRYFGGGTVEMVVACDSEQWHAPKRELLHERLEDGTLPVHSIVALHVAMDVHRNLFGPMSRVAWHLGHLADRLYEGLASLRHGNGTRVCALYSLRVSSTDSGPVIAFNVRSSTGTWVSLAEFEKLASLKNFHVRTGGVCNPGGIAAALGLRPWEMKKNFSSGLRCGSDNDIIAGKPTGVIRVSLGAMSTISDVDRFITFVAEFYVDHEAAVTTRVGRAVPVTSPQASATALCVHSITVYPIKSCGGYSIPQDVAWEVRPEGLVWDREWCLLHRGTRQALSQKRYPRMALLRPTLDFDAGVLRVAFRQSRRGSTSSSSSSGITVPLSHNPALFEPAAATNPFSPRVCGEEIAAHIYRDPHINNFFSDALGVSCVLARFPPSGGPEGMSTRHAKAHLQKHQLTANAGANGGFLPLRGLPGSFSAASPPSPPDSDSDTGSEAQQQRCRILLSNESPVLLISQSSLASLNEDVAAAGRGKQIPADVFRANVVIGPSSTSHISSLSPSSPAPAARTHGVAPDAEATLAPYAEDGWRTVRVGAQDFHMLGSCRRCHMICIDQETGEKGQEPFVTLSKTRRFDGKVFFGVHMGPVPKAGTSEYAMIRVGDVVLPSIG